MGATFVVGALFGDEGKGRVAYEESRAAALVVRPTGGPNARHAAVHAGRRFELRQVPIGVFHRATALLGPAMLVEPFELLRELDGLAAAGIDTSRVRLSSSATVVLPLHAAADAAADLRRGPLSLGTTRTGFGPAMVDKVRRIALRVEDLGDRARIARFLDERAHHGEPLGRRERARLQRSLLAAAGRLRPRVVDGRRVVRDALERRRNVVIEGSQGALLDLDHGTWPFVTASSPTVSGALNALGLPPRFAGRVVGVTRAYVTRIAAGPLPTEVSGFEEGSLRAATREYQIRLGWLDACALRRSHELNGFDELVVTSLDQLSGLERIRLCVDWRRQRPVYRDFDGFTGPLGRVASARQLPLALRAFLDALEERVGVPIRRFSVSPAGRLSTRG